MKITKPVALVASAVIVAVLGIDAATWLPKNTAKSTNAQPATSQQTAQTTYVHYDGQDGKTAMELLKAKTTVVTKDSSYGAYVDSINGAQGDASGKYWTFYVNGSMAQEGADAYMTKAGDKIEWKLQ